MKNKPQEKGLWDKATDFLGGAWEGMSALDKLALASAPVPIVGDIIGGVADVTNIGQQWMKTGEFPKADAALALTGLLPFVPPMAATRGFKSGLKSMADKAVHHAPNYLPGFYGGGPGGRLGGFTYGAVQGGKNMLQAAYSPKAQGMWDKHGVSLTDQKVIRENLDKLHGKYKKKPIDYIEEKFSGESVMKNADKKAMGQINQSRLFDAQYNKKSFYNKIDGMDQKDFADLNSKVYKQVIGKSSGLSQEALDGVFKRIEHWQKVDPSRVGDYRMAIRRPITQSSGNLASIMKASGGRVFAGKNINGLKDVFSGRKAPFKSNEDLMNALESKGMRVDNKADVLEKGSAPILVGSTHSDAYELGGVNYLTTVKKDGTVVSIMNDENDLFVMKAPGAKRMFSVSTPIHFDLLNRSKKSDAVQKSLLGLKTEAQEIRDNILDTMAKIEGVDVTQKLPKGNVLNKAQYATMKGIDKLDAPAAYAPVVANVALASGRAAKPLERGERNLSQRPY